VVSVSPVLVSLECVSLEVLPVLVSLECVSLEYVVSGSLVLEHSQVVSIEDKDSLTISLRELEMD